MSRLLANSDHADMYHITFEMYHITSNMYHITCE